jgi:hypothetical protein
MERRSFERGDRHDLKTKPLQFRRHESGTAKLPTPRIQIKRLMLFRGSRVEFLSPGATKAQVAISSVQISPHVHLLETLLLPKLYKYFLRKPNPCIRP